MQVMAAEVGGGQCEVVREEKPVTHSLLVRTKTTTEAWKCNESVRHVIQSGSTVLLMLSADVADVRPGFLGHLSPLQ